MANDDDESRGIGRRSTSVDADRRSAGNKGTSNASKKAPVQRGSAEGSRLAGEPGKKLRPVLLVGVLRGLVPEMLTVSREKKGPGRTVSVRNVDFRRAAGFDESARRAVAALGFREAETAEVKAVNSNKELVRAIRTNGMRQTIYLGHALGPGGLEPGGLDTPPVDEKALGAAFGGRAPHPIFVGCYGGETSFIGTKAPKGVVGLRQFLRWRDTDVSVSGAGMRRQSLTVRDIRINAIDLGTEGKPSAPQVPLGSHEPEAPP